jgi:hypothetical protein
MARFTLLLLPLFLRAQTISFSRQIAPILNQKCAPCHNAHSPAANLNLTAFPANPMQILDAISGTPPRMPKAGPRITPTELSLISQWINQGAANDQTTSAPTQWWSQRPLTTQATKPGPHSIDQHIRTTLAAHKLTPSPPADRRTLLRRLTYDLHGLPPTPEELRAFEQDPSPNATEAVIDRLLASPRYGERWARHWLDTIHYGDSHGYDKDKPRPHAWRYRDWVIRAFNQDKPYHQFLREQIAGDVLDPDSPDAIIATGFLAAGPWDFVGHQELREHTSDKDQTRLLDRDDMIAATMSTFNSQTFHCARCHDHKFDPIKQSEYYALQAVFAGIDRADRPIDKDPATAAQRRALLAAKRQLLLKLQPLRDQAEFASTPALDALKEQIQNSGLLLAHLGIPKNAAEEAEKQRLTAKRKADTEARNHLLAQHLGPETIAKTTALEAELRDLRARLDALPAPDLVYAVSNTFDRVGNFRPALAPRAVDPPPAKSFQVPQGPADEGQRRLNLANHLAHRDNHFTWRSIVNRVWHYHFGAGIVDSPNDFGRMGAEPSHPELLDLLAVWFRDEAKGSLKQLHKLILMSATYQQSSAHRPDMAKLDAANRYLWRMNSTRLDAESIRDSLLAISGSLDPAMYGPAVRMFAFKDDHSPIYDYENADPQGPGMNRRSIYRFAVRSVPDPFLDRLDCPDPSVLTPKRNTTITAIQALTLLNNPFVARMSEALAAQLPPDSAITAAYHRTLLRPPTTAERNLLESHANKHGLAAAIRILFNTNEFSFID